MPDRDLPPYRRIADDLRAAIAAGRLAPGEKLKSENELKDEYGTTRVTVRKALSLLKAAEPAETPLRLRLPHHRRPPITRGHGATTGTRGRHPPHRDAALSRDPEPPPRR
ncbi:GntR family transcriptional regulator [Streptomyces prunicolor]|uniref:winged helix-turn-helix domain-containing protein n=1 Tax=Streptomyces prunicolor TaxID=67348 RepID=UPI00225A7E80|nr:GntR family transcriptional regulator [Streptomyces prunicolor]MCX5234010.1 GntR family transcriptional regulator [Streptomyces prunicolor]